MRYTGNFVTTDTDIDTIVRLVNLNGRVTQGSGFAGIEVVTKFDMQELIGSLPTSVEEARETAGYDFRKGEAVAVPFTDGRGGETYLLVAYGDATDGDAEADADDEEAT